MKAAQSVARCVLMMGFMAIPSGAQNAASPPPAVTPAGSQPDQSRLLKASETFVRDLFAWGPEVKVKLGPLAPSAASDFYTVPIEVTLNDQTQSGEVYVSKDGKTLLRGEIYDMATDPFSANREKIQIQGSPSKGPANARVTLVEYSDYECPHCRQLYDALKTIEPRFPQVRIVHKDFPLTLVHPWAATAALGGQCAFEQSPTAFWKVHDAIFDNQDLISTENVWDMLMDFAKAAGLNGDAFKACMASPEAEKVVAANHDEGVALGVNSTPTVYINGRPLVGGDAPTLEQYINFELAAHAK